MGGITGTPLWDDKLYTFSIHANPTCLPGFGATCPIQHAIVIAWGCGCWHRTWYANMHQQRKGLDEQYVSGIPMRLTVAVARFALISRWCSHVVASSGCALHWFCHFLYCHFKNHPLKLPQLWTEPQAKGRQKKARYAKDATQMCQDQASTKDIYPPPSHIVFP